MERRIVARRFVRKRERGLSPLDDPRSLLLDDGPRRGTEEWTAVAAAAGCWVLGLLRRYVTGRAETMLDSFLGDCANAPAASTSRLQPRRVTVWLLRTLLSGREHEHKACDCALAQHLEVRR